MGELGGVSYRIILKDAFAERLARNPRYSLRAFARDIGISSARLSEIFKARQGLSRDRAMQIAERLGFSDQKIAFFGDLAECQHGRSKTTREQARKRLRGYSSLYKEILRLDQFKLICDWYHFAILSLTRVKNFRNDLDWMAERLGLEVYVVEAAVDRLKRLKLLAEEDGNLRETGNVAVNPGDVPSHHIRTFHRQILERALVALKHGEVTSREFMTLVLPMDLGKIARGKKMIADFVRSFDQEMESGETLEGVYCLSVQFFDLEVAR